MRYAFGECYLDLETYTLHRAGDLVPLRPKAFAVLVYLLRHRDRVVSKQELCEQVWPEQWISDATLASTVVAVRHALGDDGRAPRLLQTRRGRGYRFMAAVHEVSPPPKAVAEYSPAPLAPAAQEAGPWGVGPGRSTPLVGREPELGHLQERFARACAGQRQVVFVSGEAGMGKTTLVEAFVRQVAATGGGMLAQGQCVEHYGEGEPYRPVLEAVDRLCRGPLGPQVVFLLRQEAPLWLVQLPGILPPGEAEALERRLAHLTHVRMQREFVVALEQLTAAVPLVLVLEDLHWSDASTLDLLTGLAQRREAARLLVLGTYRPGELLVHQHPLKTVKQELATHGQCVELPLGALRRQAVAAYIAQCTAAPEARPDVAAWVYRRTAGHPLFMVQLVEYLAQQGRLQAPVSPAAGRGGAPALDQEIPQGLRQWLEAQLERLGTAEQAVLEAGSVAGAEFTIASVAAALQTAPDAIEAICEGLARRGQFLEDRGLVEWPDGTISGRYGFRHALYQEVVYTRLGTGRRARWHRAIGTREEAGYGGHASTRAAGAGTPAGPGARLVCD